MAYKATVFSVMIASPADVIEKRNIIRDIIHEWNDINSKSTKCVVLPVSWETHSAPDLSGRAQDIINQNVLDNCDLLIGVFWTRLGTPTGDFESGTVEEIKRHINEKKPAMVYFSTAPVAPESLDPVQYSALKEFKKWCLDQGLVETYDNISDFSEKFRRQIQIKIRDNLNLSQAVAGGAQEFFGEANSVSDGAVEERLSNEAQRLLVEAAKDRNRIITHMRYIGGQAIQTNGINFVDSKDQRSIARWEAALEQLQGEKLIKPRGVKGEVFEVTSRGFDIADKLSPLVG